MIIVLLIILLGVFIVGAYFTYQEYKLVKELEQETNDKEELILCYQRLMKEIKGRCEEGLKSTVIVTSRHTLKEIKASIENLE